MFKNCNQCGVRYNDARQSTICPHDALATYEEKQRAIADAQTRQELLDLFNSLPLKECGLIVLDISRAMLHKQNNYSPHGSLLMRLQTHDKKLTVCLAQNEAAPLLATAHDALKQHIGAQ